MFSAHFSKRRAAFTLIELMVVMAIIGLLVVMSVPAYHRITASLDMTNAGQLLVAQLDNAQQTALASNRTVEMRFYQVPDALSAETPRYFRGIQGFMVLDDGTLSALGKVVYLPESVTLSDDVSQSPPLSVNVKSPGTEDLPLPGYGLNYRYVVLRFRANGQLDGGLGNVNDWFMTVCKKSLGRVDTSKPGDFITVKIDPVSGRTMSYRR
ncbi:MAG: Verru_Chthon cassette protein D [Verrucomicrobiales bacterium]|jgi:uncharacterized protein (TIGR02596 family)|nr:Verru_Chthon cassette protein D [Verrucomicrobiales bacterium]